MPVENLSWRELLTGVAGDVSQLAKGRMTEMRDEVKDELSNLKRYMLRIAIGVGIVVVGAILVGHLLASALNAMGVPLWGGYAIAAVIMLAGGYLLLTRYPADPNKRDLVPEETAGDIKQDVEEIVEAVRH
jgi:hypothetical protein